MYGHYFLGSGKSDTSVCDGIVQKTKNQIREWPSDLGKVPEDRDDNLQSPVTPGTVQKLIENIRERYG